MRSYGRNLKFRKRFWLVEDYAISLASYGRFSEST